MAIANTLVFIPIILVLLFLLSKVFLAIWVYNDAKINSDEPLIWLLICIVVPVYLGVLLYLIVGRKASKVQCSNCGTYNNLDNNYCRACGNTLEKKERETKPGNNIFAILSIVSILLAFLVIFGLLFTLNYINHRNINSGNIMYSYQEDSKARDHFQVDRIHDNVKITFRGFNNEREKQVLQAQFKDIDVTISGKATKGELTVDVYIDGELKPGNSIKIDEIGKDKLKLKVEREKEAILIFKSDSSFSGVVEITKD